MLIKIKCDDGEALELSTDDLENDTFVDLRATESTSEATVCVCIDDLEAAVQAFRMARANRAQRDYEINLQKDL